MISFLSVTFWLFGTFSLWLFRPGFFCSAQEVDPIPERHPEERAAVDGFRADELDAEGEAQDGGDGDLGDEEAAEKEENLVERSLEAGKLVLRDLRVQRHFRLLPRVDGHGPDLSSQPLWLNQAYFGYSTGK